MEGALIKEIEVRMQAENPDLEEIQSIYLAVAHLLCFPLLGSSGCLGLFYLRHPRAEKSP